MNKQHQQAYLDLISALLTCPSGQEAHILSSAKPDLIDMELVEVMEEVAAVYVEQGDQNTADFLTNVAHQIAEALNSLLADDQTQTGLINTSVDYSFFFAEMLQTAIQSDSDPEMLYPLLAANLDKLDDHCAQQLQAWPNANLTNFEPQEARKTVAAIGNISNLLLDFPLGNRASNLAIALVGCEVAANFFTRQTFPTQWAAIQINLGNVYKEQLRGERVENLEQAISCYQAALEIFTCEAFPYQWGLAQNNLGNVYLERIYGDRAQNLELAINSYNLALQARTRETMPQDWAQTQANLSSAYRNRIYGDRTQNLELAITACQEALQVLTPNDFPSQWAITKTNLGNAYQERILGNHSENIETAIAVYQDALQVRTREAFPEGWAEIQVNLGNAYRTRISGNRSENLEMAIAAYEEALQVYTYEALPQRWALTQINLGNAFQERIRNDRAENLEMAIAAYESALQVITHEEFPQYWVKIQINLGAAHQNRILGNRAENLENAIAAYQKALQVCTQDTFPQNWAEIQNNLANAYSERIKGEKAENLEMAIVAYKAALQVFTREAFPQDWAFIQTNLAAIYSERIREDRAKNLETAIAICQFALQVFTREAFPLDWARVQSNLAAAYYDKMSGNREQNLAAAMAACQSVLQIYSREVFPQDYTRTLFTLGLIYQESRQLQNAYTTFASAIESVEFQSSRITSGEPAKQKLASQWARHYWSMVEVCLELALSQPHYYAIAIEYVERSKARSLVELIATLNVYPKSDISENIIDELKRLRRQISAKQREMDIIVELEQLDETNRIYQQQLRQELHSLQQQLKQLLEEIERVDPNFSITQKVEPIRFDEIRQLPADNQTAIIEWYITGEAIFTFVITHQTEYPKVLRSSTKEKTALMDWIVVYISEYAENKDQWQQQLSERLHHLAQILHIDDVLSNLPKTCNQLILIPHLFLHLFPLHALPIDDDSCLLDRFPRGVRYAPSCQLLQLSQNQTQSDFTHLFAVQNPTEDLSYSDIEVQTIQHMFETQVQVLVKTAAKKEVIDKQQLRTAHCLHFSCHGYFNSDTPMLSALLMQGSLVAPGGTSHLSYSLSLPDGSAIDLSNCLTLVEIFSLSLSQCRLVTLSACETGFIDFRILSDEYIGLPSGFLVAGSPNVVSSLWMVNDLSTAFLMIKFYHNLQLGDAVAVALNQAQLWLRDVTKVELQKWLEENQLNLSPAVKISLKRRFQNLPDNNQPFRKPFLWAGFCAIGQ
ncbi:CHAT domain-containing protein [Aetokthonos hydrillicola Thurmond2011]|jgi:CHAT domain-containing protein|uniref:CHAT domain-containing protein n=1 Tax=Aetokthonos hydrillicola Thurmond2011 TaxID=2712845 RepID=A0AAP5M7Z1_9CYAN|nr:CHAT domain-containing tetratricopeptide repeat protein [Aetokthonos hydrillicola]MBO3460157.1 CHAT domain-containing protein [Aetokthonos hydrillicola CCALA 1050]MBW4590484.1 CHAT domain-containing protein [Aetokthonos hydrillicola CCALA 1050]MDR9893013.1 CHAT domain-containing protein [Aetokthonos hydrillicola Thurmond2011]